MDPLTLGLLGGTSLISAGLGYLGSQNQANASREASQQQAQMQAQALQAQMIQHAQTREDLAPYRDTGTSATNMLTERLPYLTSPINMDQATLENTPGYQFTRTQGLKAAQSSAAARGLGVSGAAFKGALNYGTGLADSTYRNQFDMENINRTNAFNRLYQTAGLGENAAASTGTLGQANVNSQSGIMGNIGNAQAAGTLGAAAATNQGYNAIGSGINNLTSLYYMNNLFGGGNNAEGGGNQLRSGMYGYADAPY